ncbi:O-antigen ligase [Microbacterium sp. MYb66]|uniref:O-antigen ligase family protein n=1 Tax=Microbacterium sp. MYb66 TaxID=1848692 RepID=UPI000CFE7031|nr:O-antigen ligase family protein [Microbacterium sp. MYb66]PRA81982.1 hypothetical protein CQ045_04555 [Microbacterium sp. MYb66]
MVPDRSDQGPIATGSLHTKKVASSSATAEPRNRLATLIVFCLPTLAAFGPFIPAFGPVFAFRIASILLLLIAVVGTRSTTRSGVRRSTAVLAAVWMFASLISLLFVGPVEQAWTELLSVATGLGALLALTLLPDPRRTLAFFLRGWLFAYVVISALAVAEVVTGVAISSSLPQELTLDGWGLTVTFFNPNNYATFLLYSCLAILALLAQVRSVIATSVCVAALISIPVLMTFTGSRTGLWLLAVFVIASIVLLRSRASLKIALIAATIVVAFVVLSNMEETPFEELANHIGNAGYSVEVLGFTVPMDASTHVRWELVLAGFAFFALHPLFGGGPGAFEQFVASNGIGSRTLGVISPHNGFMEVLSQYGIFVFVALVFWLGRMLLIGVRSRRGADRAGSVGGIVMVVGVVSLPLVLTMHSSALEPSTTWLFFGLLVLIARSFEATLLLANVDPGDVSRGPSMSDGAAGPARGR